MGLTAVTAPLRRWLGLTLACLAGVVGAAEPAPIEDAPAQYYVEDIKEAMVAYIDSRVEEADGVFRILDEKTGETLTLEFVEIHDPVRQIDDRTYFACTDFRVVGEPDKLYDIDFWLRPDQGRLQVYDEKIHKEPRHSLLYGWYKHPRYTFVKDKVELLY
jgi:hypothetical protein